MKMHADLTPEHWFTFSFFAQLSNIGMDIERTMQWKKKGDQESSTNAFFRALELLDLTIADPKNKGGKRKELCRVREFLVDYFMYDNQYNFTDQAWHDYFFFFAYAAAVERGR